MVQLGTQLATNCTKFLGNICLRKLGQFYSWIVCQLEVGFELAFLLVRSDFESEASFGYLSPNYTGHVT